MSQKSVRPERYSDTVEVPLSDDELLATDGEASVLAVDIHNPKKAKLWVALSLFIVGGAFLGFSMYHSGLYRNLFSILLIPTFTTAFIFSLYRLMSKEIYGTYEGNQDEAICVATVLLTGQHMSKLKTLNQDKKATLSRKDRVKPDSIFLQSFFANEAPDGIIWDMESGSNKAKQFKVSQHLSFDGSNYQLRQVTTPVTPMTVPPLP